ncbi:hypothetical protein ACSSS7_007652 [Eimeria intestinalis]
MALLCGCACTCPLLPLLLLHAFRVCLAFHLLLISLVCLPPNTLGCLYRINCTDELSRSVRLPLPSWLTRAADSMPVFNPQGHTVFPTDFKATAPVAAAAASLLAAAAALVAGADIGTFTAAAAAPVVVLQQHLLLLAVELLALTYANVALNFLAAKALNSRATAEKLRQIFKAPGDSATLRV